ncbi:MAG: MATE family efflux transporter [Oscillospiraceae bacterium]|nr:MATE family efflux transporter [Oscillospiraceae bacterium]MDY3064584.1 MATE family efflux transporter [Oscillospiraceae bacterium]
MFTSREFFGILGPVIIDQFFMYLISMLTTAMISASSQDSVSAVSLVNPILFLVMALFGAVANGGTVVVAQYKGKGNPLRVRQAAGQSVLATFIVAAMAAVLLCLLANPIVMLLFGTAGESVCGRATEYLIGMAISFLPFSFYSASFSALRGVGDSKSCLRLTIIINVIHLVLSMIFLNVMHLDIFGTILSYFLARIVGGATALYSLMNKHGQISVRFSDIFRFEPKLLKSIFRMGIPFAIEQCFYNGGTVIVQTYMVQLGNIAVAANAIANSVFSLIYAAGFAVSVVTLTVTGQCIGAGEIALAKYYGRRMEWLGNAICTLSVIVILPLMPFLLMLYAPEAQTLPVIYPLLWIGSAFMPFVWSGANVMSNTLRAAGDANFTSVTSLVCMWVARVGLGYLLALPLGLGINGVWIAMGIEWVIKTIVFRIRFRGDKWYCNKVVEE